MSQENMSQDNIQPRIFTLGGSPDLSKVEPDEMVLVQGARDSRAIEFPAGKVLDMDRNPIHDAPDGATRRLDGADVIKLLGVVIAVSDPSSDKY